VIGNDIVDLALAQQESNWQRKGFLNKIFTPKEQEFILTSPNPENMLWNLWSRKEAAYKIYNRQTSRRVFNPIQFECEADTVVIGNTIYYTQTEITSEFVYTVAVTSKNFFDEVQHFSNRENIQKINGIPIWLNKENDSLHPVSITHHGRFYRIIVLM